MKLADVKNVRMSPNSLLVPASADPVIGVLNQRIEKDARGHSMLELAFSWLAARPQVASVIAGATRVEQVEQNVKAISWSLSVEDMAEIDEITK